MKSILVLLCNQACLDNVFSRKIASCLVNPKACHESEFSSEPAKVRKNIAVIGSGPAGLSFSVEAAKKGHSVTLFDRQNEVGGQFNLAKTIPGKEEFHETIRYFKRQMELAGVKLQLGANFTEDQIKEKSFDHYVLASGIKPRIPKIEGIDHYKAISYIDTIKNPGKIGKRVAIIGAGGIGFDVAELLLHDERHSQESSEFFKTWGVDPALKNSGGLTPTREEKSLSVNFFSYKEKKDVWVKDLAKQPDGFIELV